GRSRKTEETESGARASEGSESNLPGHRNRVSQPAGVMTEFVQNLPARAIPAVLASRDAGAGPSIVPSIPVIAFAIHGTLVVGTDDGEWSTLGPSDQLVPAASTGRSSAAVCDANGTLTIASWEPKLTQYRDGTWTSIALAAPALALAAT